MANAPEAAPAEIKPGYKTTEFWVTLAAGIAPYAIAAVPPQYALLASTALGGLYTVGRSVVKYKQAEGKWSSVQLPDPAIPQQ